jgi:hypothetical protein
MARSSVNFTFTITHNQGRNSGTSLVTITKQQIAGSILSFDP